MDKECFFFKRFDLFGDFLKQIVGGQIGIIRIGLYHRFSLRVKYFFDGSVIDLCGFAVFIDFADNDL